MLKLSELHNRAASLLPAVRDLFHMDQSKLSAMLGAKEKERQYFAPIYGSNVCGASCPYCAFHKGSGIERITLTSEQALAEATFLKEKGYDAAYCLTGSFPEKTLGKIGSMTEVNARVLRAIHSVGLFPVLESSPFSPDNLRALLKCAGGFGRYVLFMETYNTDTYMALHGNDRYKGNPEKRLQQVEVAQKAGWKELGIGALLGLHKDIEAEIAGITAHYEYLVHTATKITISVPRINSATDVASSQWVIPDDLFLKAVIILQILCPDAWIVLTGRESPMMRDILFPLINRCIIGARGSTVPGGYVLNNNPRNGQFMLIDTRPLDILKRRS